MMHCKVCGGDLLSGDTLISSNRTSCKCTMQIFPHFGENSCEGLELLHLQNRQFEILDNVTELTKKMRSLDASKSLEHDVVDHLKGNMSAVHQPISKTLTSIPRRNPFLSKHAVSPSSQKKLSQLTHYGTNSNAVDQAEMRPSTAPGGPISEFSDLRGIREEIAMLHRKFDEELKSMRDVLNNNIVGMARLFETSKAAAETEGKENTAPGSILSGAQQALLDATRRRRMFETSVANCERSRAQRNVFDILEHLDDGDSDVLRMRALLDDAVNNLEIPQKPEPISPKVPNLSSRLARLSAPKQSKVVSRKPQKSPTQRPSSLPPTSTAAVATSPRGRSTGLADLVDFSTVKTTTAPLMKRSKVVLPSNISPKVDPQITKRGKIVRFEETCSRPRSTLKVMSSAPSSDKQKASVFLPLGMRQYSMWPTEKLQMLTTPPVLQTTTAAAMAAVDSAMEDETLTRALRPLLSSSASQQPQSASEAKLTPDDLKEMLDAALKNHLERQMPPTELPPVRPQLRDVNVGICRQDFMKEEALSPIHAPGKFALTDRASSPKSITEPPKMVSHGNSVNSVRKPRSSSLPSITSEVVVTSEKLQTGSITEAEASTEFPGGDQIDTEISTEKPNYLNECEYEATEGLDANRSEVCFDTWDISTIQTEVKITHPLMVSNNRTQSPILADAGEVSTPATLTRDEEGDGFSLTEPHTFSDGVWLDADRSEGEAGGVAMFEAEEAADLARELGPLPSSSDTSETTNLTSEATRGHSEGEFTLNQMNHQLGVWVAPWRDPLLHLIALNAAGKNSRLPWNQQHKIQKIAQILARRGNNQAPDPAEVCCSITEDLSWVEGVAARVGVSSPPSTLKNGERSAGEVVLPISVKQQLRRRILAKSSQRMRQRDASLSDDEDTLGGAGEEVPTEKPDLLSAVKSLSDEEIEEVKDDEIAEQGSLESQVNSTPKGDSTFDIDPGVSSEFSKDPL
ncbi:conserved hypothetical protein [Echinococcus multilocularis]|uniref:Uncharacterized protein n=1 Tax=Echinococcus multilocularis TaxID=6211 RepID=A0A087VXE9_ECHMU|nr:conserved hypothetical protein [Echinococcus multilocularis]